MDDDFGISQDELKAKVGPRAKIVSLTQVSNVLGTQNDIAAVAQRAHKMGTLKADKESLTAQLRKPWQNMSVGADYPKYLMKKEVVNGKKQEHS